MAKASSIRDAERMGKMRFANSNVYGDAPTGRPLAELVEMVFVGKAGYDGRWKLYEKAMEKVAIMDQEKPSLRSS